MGTEKFHVIAASDPAINFLLIQGNKNHVHCTHKNTTKCLELAAFGAHYFQGWLFSKGGYFWGAKMDIPVHVYIGSLCFNFPYCSAQYSKVKRDTYKNRKKLHFHPNRHVSLNE